MTRIIQYGAETGDTQQLGTDAQGASSGTVSIVSSSPTPRSGNYCLKCAFVANISTTGTTGNVARKAILHAAKTEAWYAFGFYHHHLGTPGTIPNICFFRLLDTAGNVNIFVFVDGGTIRAYVATAGGSAPSNAQITLLGTASASISQDAWHLIEIRAVASTGAAGTFELYLDGASVINATSARTAQTNANYAQFYLDLQNPVNTLPASGPIQGSYHVFDDVRVNDTSGSVNNGRPGDEKIVMLVPNADGDSTQFSRGGTDSGSNYGQVDERPPTGTGDYVYATTVGHTDLYNLPTVAVSAVSAVAVIAQAFNSDGAGGAVNLPTKTPAGQSDGSALSLTGTPIYYTRILETDPADSAAWTQAKLDALQIGIKLAS